MEGVFYFNRNKDKDTFGYVLLDNYEIIDVKTLQDASTALEYDRVTVNQLTGVVTSIIKRSDVEIVGVFQLSSRVFLDDSSKKFQPLFHKYPYFKVKVNSKHNKNNRNKQITDVYATVKFVSWLPLSKSNGIPVASIPVAQLVRTIGPVTGDLNVEKEMILYKYGLKHPKYKFRYDPKIEVEPEKKIESIKRVDLTDLICFSVDPKGCKDIDDVLHIVKLCNKNNNNLYQVGVHIADVSSYVIEGSELDLQAELRVESLYFSDKQINMLPDQLATDVCSLTEGKVRRAFSVLMTFKDTDLIDVLFEKTLIINKHCLSYEEAEMSVEQNIYPELNMLYDLGNILNNNNNINTVYNCHKMVETFMVLANTSVANKLVNMYSDNILLRKHVMNLNTDNIKHVDEKLVNIATILQSNRATYVVNSSNCKHDGLNKQYYTHFTSPIRRYADILVHRQLFNTINGLSNKNSSDKNSLKYVHTVNRLNTVQHMIQKAYREEKKLIFTHKLKEINDVVDTVGTVVAIRSDINNKVNNKVTVYLDDYDVVWSTTTDKEVNLFDNLDVRLVILNRKTLLQIL